MNDTAMTISGELTRWQAASRKPAAGLVCLVWCGALAFPHRGHPATRAAGPHANSPLGPFSSRGGSHLLGHDSEGRVEGRGIHLRREFIPVSNRWTHASGTNAEATFGARF